MQRRSCVVASVIVMMLAGDARAEWRPAAGWFAAPVVGVSYLLMLDG